MRPILKSLSMMLRPPARSRRVPLLLAGLAMILAGCGKDMTHDPPAPRASATVPIATAILDNVDDVIRASGAVEPWVRTSPGTKILGRVSRVPLREGDPVGRGDLLVQLEDADLRAAVQQARAAVGMAEATLENAAANHRRMAALFERGSVTEKNLEDAVSGLRVAEAAVAQAVAAREAAEVTLGYAQVRSPIAGHVVGRHVEVGDMAAPGAPLLTVEDRSKVKIVVQVPERDVVGLASGDPAEIDVDVLGRRFDAKIDRILPAGDPATRTYDVKLVVDNPDGSLRTSMFARARFVRGSTAALIVPESAVVSRGQLRGLFVVDGEGVARLRWVRLGRVEDGRVTILAGLEAGERYVAAPPAGFADATPVAEG